MALSFNVSVRDPYIIVSATTSTQGVKLQPESGLGIGYVEWAYTGCQQTAVGDTVMYRTDGELSFSVGAKKYFVIRESNIVFYETFIFLG